MEATATLLCLVISTNQHFANYLCPESLSEEPAEALAGEGEPGECKCGALRVARLLRGGDLTVRSDFGAAG